jgi:lysosomal acid lipase/cholesteryl ester hydrolase
MWQSILYPPIFVRFIDISLRFLFNWSAVNILPEQKLAAYPHLYSYTSTKSVVHWFQIIRNGTFQMYDDEAPNPLTSNRSKYYKVAKFPTKNIKTPIVLVYGGSDSLVDINVMLKELPSHTIAKEIPHYEHLDFLWAESVNTLVFPYVFEALDKFAGSEAAALEDQKQRRLRSPGRYQGLLPESSKLPGLDGDDYDEDDAGDESATAPVALRTRKVSQHSRTPSSIDGTTIADRPLSLASAISPPKTTRPSTHRRTVTEEKPSPVRSRVMSPPPSNRMSTVSTPDPSNRISTISFTSPGASVGDSQITEKTSTSRPEGWWSSDEVAGTDPSQTTTPANHTPARRSSFDSEQSTKSMAGKFGANGITLGAGKAVSGVTQGEGFDFGEGSSDKSKINRERLLEADRKQRRNVLKKRQPSSG